MSFAEVEIKVIRWAEARQIIPNSTPQAQLLKTLEELGELAAALARNQKPKACDAIGDVMVCLINLCALMDVDLTRCLEDAYEEIKDRRGTMTPEGIFVKEE